MVGAAKVDERVRPLLIGGKMRRYMKFVKIFGRITVGKCSPQPPIRPVEEAQRVLVIAPHPDDEVLGCGGTVKKYGERGAHIKTLYFTDGSEGNPDLGGQELATMRRQEAEEGLKIIGCHDSQFLDNKDGDLRADRNAIGATGEVLDMFHPDIIFVPFIFDNHSDHIQSAIALAEALKNYREPVICYCYEVWTPLFPNLLVDITDTIDAKMKAMDAHRSQIDHQNIKECVFGLNSYRAIGWGKKVKACEAFYRCSRKEYIKIVLDQGKIG
ncbi:MAG: PIG-L deacetylase family protein [Methanomassiliicoccus sp.]|nr:PIG-L deacetylase family protein [Methanomassiliicoccus sp.]